MTPKLLPALLLLAATATAPSAGRAAALTWSYSADVLTLDPHASNNTFTNAFLGNVYESLVRMNERIEIEPALAASWERTSDTVWVFHLRPGVTFHNGDKLTADDVVFTWARFNTPGALARGTLSGIKAMRSIDPLTVEIETIGPFPILLNALQGFYVMDHGWAEAHGAMAASDLTGQTENFASRNENGTGPYAVASRSPDGPTVLRPYAGWWDHPDHKLPDVTFLPIRAAATRTASLISGTTDATVELPLQDVDRVRATPGLQVIQGPELRTIYLGFDQFRDQLLTSDVTGKNPFKDHRVREAIYRAIDIAAIRHVVMRDTSWPAGMMASPFLTGAPQDINDRLPYDPARAKQLLAEAGYPDGFSTEIACPNDRYVNDERICQAVAAMLAKIGIRLAVRAETTAAWSRRTGALDVSMFMLGHAGLPLADAYSTLSEVLHSRTETQGGLNVGRYSNPKLDALVDAVRTATDETRRRALIREALLLEKTDIGHIPLHQQPITWAAKTGIDLHQGPDNQLRLRLVTVP
jgi:peptide/nickel transport system substrate-binding protein